MEVIRQLPFEEYVKRPGVNGSLLKTVDRYSLAHAKAQLDGLDEYESDALDFGTSFHALLLEGRVDYALIPDTYENDKGEVKPWSWNANVCKKWEADQGGRTPLTKKEVETLEKMVAAVHDNPQVRPFLNGDTELSVFAEREGLPVKARIDLLPSDPQGPVIDFKKARSSEPGQFLKSSLDLRYHMSAAWNLDVLRWTGDERKEFWLVAVEDRPPYAVSVLKFLDVPMSFIRVGRSKCRTAFKHLQNAYATNRWPDYGTHVAEDHAKPWMLPELELTA
jgi:hypothetical protein